jgi:hypothetical protein
MVCILVVFAAISAFENDKDPIIDYYFYLADNIETCLAWTKTEFIIHLISNIISANYRVVSIYKVQETNLTPFSSHVS